MAMVATRLADLQAGCRLVPECAYGRASGC